MKAADKLIAIALAVGSLLFLGWLVLRFFLPATLPFSLPCCVRCRCSFLKSCICDGAALLPL